MDFQERTCKPAAARLRGSRDSEHKNNDISFTLDPKATKFLRGVYKYINYVLAKGFIIDFVDQRGTSLSLVEVLLAVRTAEHNVSKRHQNSIKLGLWLVIYGKEHVYKMGTWERASHRGSWLPDMISMATNAMMDSKAVGDRWDGAAGSGRRQGMPGWHPGSAAALQCSPGESQ